MSDQSLPRFECLEDRAVLNADACGAAVPDSTVLVESDLEPSPAIVETAAAQIDAPVAVSTGETGEVAAAASAHASAEVAANAAIAEFDLAAGVVADTGVTAGPQVVDSLDAGGGDSAATSTGSFVNPDYVRERFGREAGPEPNPSQPVQGPSEPAESPTPESSEAS